MAVGGWRRSPGEASPGSAAHPLRRAGTVPLQRLTRALGGVLVAGVVLLLVVAGAGSMSLLPFQLDSAGRQACAATLAVPGPAQRAEAVELARRSGERGLREAAGRAGAAPPDARFGAVQHWCASND